MPKPFVTDTKNRRRTHKSLHHLRLNASEGDVPPCTTVNGLIRLDIRYGACELKLLARGQNESDCTSKHQANNVNSINCCTFRFSKPKLALAISQAIDTMLQRTRLSLGPVQCQKNLSLQPFLSNFTINFQKLQILSQFFSKRTHPCNNSFLLVVWNHNIRKLGKRVPENGLKGI